MSSQASEYAPKVPEDSGEPQVLVRSVNHFFGSGESRKQGLFENNLTLMPGEIVIMTGPSGSGKTTLLTLIGALRTLQEGSIEVLGKQLQGLGSSELTQVRQDIGFIFQAHNLFESLTAFQNVRMALELHIERHTSKELTQLATEILTRVGLGDRIHYRPRHLSGGQRQRVAIARALVNRPRLILADEPTAALDKDSGAVVMELLRELSREQGSTVLIVTHDKRVIDAADRIVTMVDGAIASEVLVEESVTICEFLLGCPAFQSGSEVSQSVSEAPDAEAVQVGVSARPRLSFSNSPALLTQMARKMRKERFPAETTIIHEGDAGDTFYIIRDGSVRVHRGADGAQESLGTLGSGDYFGEVALIRDEPRNATVVAGVDTVVYTLNKADFLAAVSASGSFDDQLRGQMFQA